MAVTIVTDSTVDIPDKLFENLDIRVVPIYLRFGDNTYRDGIDITRDQFYSMLTSLPVHPATSQPNPEDFINVYKECCDNQASVVSIHISSKISGTYNSAIIARKTMDSPCQIEIIDSQLNSGGLGLVVLAGARKAQAGASIEEVVDEVNRAVNEVKMFGLFETMKYLARGGRVNKTIAMASSILNVMPLLTFHDGEIVRAGLVRSINKGMDRICDFVKNKSPITELVLVHSKAEDRAILLKDRLSQFIQAEKITITELGAGLGVHGGPGVLLAAIRQEKNNTYG